MYAEGSRGGWSRREPGIMSNMLVRGKREKFMAAEAACAPGSKRTLGEEGSASCWLCASHTRLRLVCGDGACRAREIKSTEPLRMMSSTVDMGVRQVGLKRPVPGSRFASVSTRHSYVAGQLVAGKARQRSYALLSPRMHVVQALPAAPQIRVCRGKRKKTIKVKSRRHRTRRPPYWEEVQWRRVARRCRCGLTFLLRRGHRMQHDSAEKHRKSEWIGWMKPVSHRYSGVLVGVYSLVSELSAVFLHLGVP